MTHFLHFWATSFPKKEKSCGLVKYEYHEKNAYQNIHKGFKFEE